MADIVETLKQSGDFDTFVEALKTAKLTNTLKGVGPYTVFVPNDTAFGKLPGASVQNLLSDVNVLREVLLYHVVPGELLVEDVMDEEELETIEGQNILVNTSDGLKVNNAHVIESDIEADNGIIHVIDAVIIPKVGISI